jgi:hypothetical protein
MLEAALEFSKHLVEARKRNNHDLKPVDTYEHDLQMAIQVSNITGIKQTIKKIKEWKTK